MSHWYPCCCPPIGSSTIPEPPSSTGTIPGSSGSSQAVDLSHFGQIGSSQVVGCECCTGGVAPFQIQVEVQGVVVGTAFPCDDCQQLNGTYILDWAPPSGRGEFCLPPDADCTWGLVFDEICGRNKAQLFLRCQGGLFPSVEVGFSIEGTQCDDPINSGLPWVKIIEGAAQVDCSSTDSRWTAEDRSRCLARFRGGRR